MTEENEFEKKFKEDLERAQALSLESLALEKFRLLKLEDEKRKGIFIVFFFQYGKNNFELLKMWSYVSEKKIITPDEIPRSRPRPGVCNVGKQCFKEII